MSVKILKSELVKKEVVKPELTVVNFFATWCGPCQMFAPILEETSKKYNVVKVDLDENREYAGEMKVNAVPTTFIFREGKLLEQFVGYMPGEVLAKKLESVNKAA